MAKKVESFRQQVEAMFKKEIEVNDDDKNKNKNKSKLKLGYYILYNQNFLYFIISSEESFQ